MNSDQLTFLHKLIAGNNTIPRNIIARSCKSLCNKPKVLTGCIATLTIDGLLKDYLHFTSIPVGLIRVKLDLNEEQNFQIK